MPHGLNFFLTGLLLALHLLEGVGEFVEAGDDVAEIAADDFDLRQGSFEGGLFRKFCWRRGRVLQLLGGAGRDGTQRQPQIARRLLQSRH